jgi:hypothetical protein
MHLARSEIDTPLKVSAIFGVTSGVLLLSVVGYYGILALNSGMVDYSSLVSVLFFIFLVMTYPILIILGSLAVLFARMSIERRGVLAFFVFIASVFAMMGSLFFLTLPFQRPQ